LRRIILLAAAMTLTTIGSAVAAWQGYENEELGFAVTFPGVPTEATGTYKSDLLPGVPTHYATYREGEGTFLSLVVDTGRLQDGAILLGEFEYWLSHFGDVIVNTPVRLNVGMEYGRFLSIDCREGVVSEGPLQVERAKRLLNDAAAFDCPSGARLNSGLFFTQGRLYAIMGMMTGADAALSPAPIRFVNSLEWIASNAEYGRELLARSSLAEQAAARDAERAAAAPQGN
jgi:hypothetical protein